MIVGETSNEFDSYSYQDFWDIIERRNINSVFQPIVSFKDGSIVGYEVLSRGPKDSNMRSPELLLELARKYNRLWEVEELFREKALEAVRDRKIKEDIFLNVDPLIMDSMKFKKSFTKEYLSQYYIKNKNIIFEVTEREKVTNRESFRNTIKEYKNSNYKIAIDDFGSGYSGFSRVCDINPDYIKIDMDIIRDINENSTKQAIVKSIHEFSKISGCKLIGEGIETPDELKILMDIGVEYGQGYYIQRPSSDINLINKEVFSLINPRKSISFSKESMSPKTCIGDISRKIESIKEDTLVKEVDLIFKKKVHLLGVCVVEEDLVKGIVTRSYFYSKLGWKYGYSLYSSKEIKYIMSTDFLSVDYNTSIDEVIKLAMSRPDSTLYDHITVTKNSRYNGIVTVKELIEKKMEIEVEYARKLNPLTLLPGNLQIEEKLTECLTSNIDYCVLYFDIDNFKAYNDVYGFESGDRIIKELANIISKNVERDDFFGHIGGDDFIAITFSDNVETICETIIEEFCEFSRKCYSEEDMKKGYITTQNRKGIKESFPLVSLSIAGLTNKNKNITNTNNLAREASKLKKECKQYCRSKYIIL